MMPWEAPQKRGPGRKPQRPATASNDEEPGRLCLPHASVSGSVSESKSLGRKNRVRSRSRLRSRYRGTATGTFPPRSLQGGGGRLPISSGSPGFVTGPRCLGHESAGLSRPVRQRAAASVWRNCSVRGACIMFSMSTTSLSAVAGFPPLGNGGCGSYSPRSCIPCA
jgi:hypothetical protein